MKSTKTGFVDTRIGDDDTRNGTSIPMEPIARADDGNEEKNAEDEEGTDTETTVGETNNDVDEETHNDVDEETNPPDMTDDEMSGIDTNVGAGYQKMK